MIAKIFTDTVYAASTSTATTLDAILREGDKTVAQNSGSVLTLAQSLIDRVPYILGALAVFGMMYSGFLYVMALGDATKMEMAKKNITWIFTGILAIAAVIIIMNIAVKVTGSELLKSSPLE